jgi:hypothetical protein
VLLGVPGELALGVAPDADFDAPALTFPFALAAPAVFEPP